LKELLFIVVVIVFFTVMIIVTVNSWKVVMRKVDGKKWATTSR